MAAKPKPFLRSSSLGNMFKKKHAPGYQPWDEEDTLMTDEPPARPLLSPSSSSAGGVVQEESAGSVGVELSRNLRQGVTLVESFYLGAYDMQGRTIRGRGCIDAPAGELWQQTQENGTRKRHRSVPAKRDAFRPLYVKLVAGTDELEMRDVYSEQKITSFPYAQISFVGTHPKYDRLFAFIAHESGKKGPSCYAFKCEDKLSACNTAQQLDGVFHQRCRELYAQATSKSNVSTVAVQ